MIKVHLGSLEKHSILRSIRIIKRISRAVANLTLRLSIVTLLIIVIETILIDLAFTSYIKLN